ncbi:MAG: UDP-N-acetylglucosamine 2-epimerase (non-hydrolyzing) [Bacteroidia bacterium]|nr:UDP-N-acetylglucosamine 2-epimerase (non-hydrolyzing) [Bacteroidia bacterium]
MSNYTKTVFIVVGTRPNFIKVTRFKEVAESFPGMCVKIIHTGQHYDEKMADVFFRQFKLVPDHFLNVGAGTPVSQMAGIMIGIEKLCTELRPDLMLVVGDVNSTFAAALTANKMGIMCGHVESGLRSFDRTMPEEFNRVLTDVVCDLYFVTEQSGADHLVREGVQEEKIHFVGNTMIDTLVKFTPQINASPVLEELNLTSGKFALMTMHRPATVDSSTGLEKLFDLIATLTRKNPVVFPIHPRTRKKLEDFGLSKKFYGLHNLILTDPLDYFAFQKLTKSARFVVTDSGGIQEESTFLGIPCLTLRPNTERPVTVDFGTNTLVPFDVTKVTMLTEQILSGTYKKGKTPPLWDGLATDRIMKIISNIK